MPRQRRSALNTLLTLRERAAQAQQRAFAAQWRIMNDFEQQAATLSEQIETSVAVARAEAAQPAVTPQTLIGQGHWTLHLRGAARATDARMAEHAPVLENARQVLIEAARQVQVVEQLQARQRASAAWAEQQAENRALDEFAIQQFIRRREARPC